MGQLPHGTHQVGLQLELRGGPKNPGSNRKMNTSRPRTQKGSLPSHRTESPVPWPGMEDGPQATHNGEVIIVRLCLIPIPGIQRHRVHSKQHFSCCITLCQLFGSATACVWGEGYWIITPRRPSAFHPAQTWVEGPLRCQLDRGAQDLPCT